MQHQHSDLSPIPSNFSEIDSPFSPTNESEHRPVYMGASFVLDSMAMLWSILAFGL